MMPKTFSYDVYAGSTWKRSFYTYQGIEPVLLDVEDDKGTPIDLRPYDIRMQGRRYPESQKLYFDLTKPANSSGASGLEVQGAEHNELLITLSEEITTGFDVKIVLTDLRFDKGGVVDYWARIDLMVRQSKTRGIGE